MAPQLSVKKMGIISENAWLLSISSSSTGHALTLTAGHGHMKKLSENLQAWTFGISEAGTAACVQG